ncbi:MAG: hypothetical protein Q7K54_03595 [Candidatus Parcubacteria bacterium]|nr:hypothetical protein [Candidatus Parcubacteria bacterium]
MKKKTIRVPSNLLNNKVKHISNWDGSLKTYKTEYILRKFKPKTAKRIASILRDNYNKKSKTIYDKEFPMFYNSPRLVKLVKMAKKDSPAWWNYYITHLDFVDLASSIWKLSPHFQKLYPSKKQMYMGTDIGGGWHNLLKDIRKEGVPIY